MIHYHGTPLGPRPILLQLAYYDSEEDEHWFQEDLTLHLAKALNAKVTTRGQHSGVEVTCTAEPE